MSNEIYFITDGRRYFRFIERGKCDFSAGFRDAYGFKTEKAASNFLKKRPKERELFYVLEMSQEKSTKTRKNKRRRDSVSQEKRLLIYNKSGGKCAICGREIELKNFTVDHIIPVSRGGKKNIENLQATCKRCNKAKGALTMEEFKKVQEWNLCNQETSCKNELDLSEQKNRSCMSEGEIRMREEREKIAGLLLRIDDFYVLEMIRKCIENVIKEQEGGANGGE